MNVTQQCAAAVCRRSSGTPLILWPWTSLAAWKNMRRMTNRNLFDKWLKWFYLIKKRSFPFFHVATVVFVKYAVP